MSENWDDRCYKVYEFNLFYLSLLYLNFALFEFLESDRRTHDRGYNSEYTYGYACG
jgi:hypothetical protein